VADGDVDIAVVEEPSDDAPPLRVDDIPAVLDIVDL
jgi:hypothetical protein